MQVRERNKEFKSENEFLTDCKDSLTAYFKRFRYGWPRRDLLGQELASFHGKMSVGFTELEATKMFRSHYSIKQFLLHYRAISRANEDIHVFTSFECCASCWSCPLSPHLLSPSFHLKQQWDMINETERKREVGHRVSYLPFAMA